MKQTTGQPSNGAILSDIARQFGFDRVKPVQMYINKLVKKGRLPQELAAEYEVNDMEEDFQLDEKIAGLVKKSEKSKVPYGILKKVYNRGMAAWRTGHRPGTTPQQWAFARVNSFLTGGGARKADADLWSKAKASKKAKKEDIGDIAQEIPMTGPTGTIFSMRSNVVEAKYEVQYTVGSRVGDSRSRTKSRLSKIDIDARSKQDAEDKFFKQAEKSPMMRDAMRRDMLDVVYVGLKETIEDELGEKYNLYHSTFSGAMQHAYDYAKKKLGVTVDKREIDSKVATGPKKPSEGKTNKYRLKGKGGNLQIQVFNKGGSKPFELNMYKEGFELDEQMKFYKVVGADRGAASGESSVTVKAKDEKDAIRAAKKKGLGKIKSVDIMKDYMKFLSTLKKEDLQTWYESVDTRMQYQLDHGDEWWWKMNEVHDKMLEKLGLDEGCSIDDDETPKVLSLIHI